MKELLNRLNMKELLNRLNIKEQSKREHLEEAREKALEFRRSKRWGELNLLINELQQRFGDIVPVQLLRCRSHLWSGELDLAISHARSILTDQDHPTAREFLVRAYLELGELILAESELNRLVESALADRIPGRRISALCSRLGKAFYNSQENERAMTWAVQAVRLDSNSEPAHALLSCLHRELLKETNEKAQEFRKTGRWGELDELINDLQQLLGDIVPVQLLRCRSHLWSGEFDLAICDAKAILTEQDHPMAWELLVHAYLALGELTLAEAEMSRLVDYALAGRMPGRKISGLCSRLGRALYCRCELERAMVWAVQAVRMENNTASAHALLSHLHEAAGDQAAALRSAREALKLDPLNPEAARKVYFLGGKHETQLHLEIEEIIQVIRDHKNPEKMLTLSIHFLINADRISELYALYESLHDSINLSDLGRERLLVSLAKAFVLDHAYDAALDVLNQIQHISEENSNSIKLLKSQCYFETGHFQQALQLAQEATRDQNGFDLVRFNALLAVDRIGEAFDLYRCHLIPNAMQEAFPEAYRPDLTVNEPDHAPPLILVASGGVGDEIRWGSLYNELPTGWTLSCDPRLETLLARSCPGLSFFPVPRHRTGVRNSLSTSNQSLVPSQLLTVVMDNSVVEQIQRIGAVGLVQDRLSELRRQRADFPKHAGYLIAQKALVAHWRGVIVEQSSEGQMHVALSWRSLLHSPARDRHYLQVEDLAPLGKLQGATFWVVQPSVMDQEWEALRRDIADVRPIPGLNLIDDFEGMAAFLKNMDAVISPCTTTAELSGALGVRTYLFGRSEELRWRKNKDGTDIWHPSVEVILRPGDNEMRTVLAHDLYERLYALSELKHQQPAEKITP